MLNQKSINKNIIDCFTPWENVHFANSSRKYKPAKQEFLTDTQKRLLNRDKLHLNHPSKFYPLKEMTNCKKLKDEENFSIKQESTSVSKHTNKSNSTDEFSFESNDETTNSHESCTVSDSSNTSKQSNSINSSFCKIQTVKNVIARFNSLNISNNNLNKPLEKLHRLPQIEERSQSPKKIRTVTNNIIMAKEKIYKRRKESMQLRSQKFKPCQNRDYKNIDYDELLHLLEPNDDTRVIKHICLINKNVKATMPRQKRLVSAETQTTPAASSTNILINVYNQKSFHTNDEKDVNSVEVKVCDTGTGTNLICIESKDTYPKSDVKVTRKSVRSCIEKFEECMKKKESDIRKYGKGSPTKMKSTYFLELEKETTLSIKAKSVPF